MSTNEYQGLDDNTPILVAAGQHVEREASLKSPMDIAAIAAAVAGVAIAII